MTRQMVPRTATALGLACLIPFCIVSLLLWQGVHHARLYAELLANYAFAIICFCLASGGDWL